MITAVQASFEMFGYPAHPPGIGKIAAQLIMLLPRIRTGKPGHVLSIDVEPEDFRLYDRGAEIRYMLPDGTPVDKVGTKVTDVQHYAVYYWEDPIGSDIPRTVWAPWKLSTTGHLVYAQGVGATRPGAVIHRARRGDVMEIMTINAYENTGTDPLVWNNALGQYTPRKGWGCITGEGRAREFREPGQKRNGYYVLEEVQP